MHNFTVSAKPIRMLQEGKTLYFRDRPTPGCEAKKERAFSLHGCGAGLYHWGIFRTGSGRTGDLTMP